MRRVYVRSMLAEVAMLVSVDRPALSSVPRGMRRQLYSSREQTRRMVLRSRKPSIGRFYKSRCSVLLSLQAYMKGGGGKGARSRPPF